MCLDPLPESYYELDGQAFCMEHYYEKSAHRCQKCEGYITGPTMVRRAQRRWQGERERGMEGESEYTFMIDSFLLLLTDSGHESDVPS